MNFLRRSKISACLIADGAGDLADKLTSHEFSCDQHGVLGDPIVAVVDDDVLMFCPHCSGDDVSERWEAEANWRCVGESCACGRALPHDSTDDHVCECGRAWTREENYFALTERRLH